MSLSERENKLAGWLEGIGFCKGYLFHILNTSKWNSIEAILAIDGSDPELDGLILTINQAKPPTGYDPHAFNNAKRRASRKFGKEIKELQRCNHVTKYGALDTMRGQIDKNVKKQENEIKKQFAQMKKHLENREKELILELKTKGKHQKEELKKAYQKHPIDMPTKIQGSIMGQIRCNYEFLSDEKSENQILDGISKYGKVAEDRTPWKHGNDNRLNSNTTSNSNLETSKKTNKKTHKNKHNSKYKSTNKGKNKNNEKEKEKDKNENDPNDDEKIDGKVDAGWDNNVVTTTTKRWNGAKAQKIVTNTANNMASNSNSNNNNSNNSNNSSRTSYHIVEIGGTKGLQNLGNTCYFNSTLQCLSNTVQLREYFLSLNLSQLKNNVINKNNDMNTGGDMSIAFAILMRDLWTDKNSSDRNQDRNFDGSYDWNYSRGYNYVAPWLMKNATQKHNRTLMNGHQQDSYEFLSYLLTAMHDELNQDRSGNVAYYDEMDENGNILEPRAACDKFWKEYCETNISPIRKLFHAIYRQTLQCQSCKTTWIDFDIYSYLSLPIIENNKQKQKRKQLAKQKQKRKSIDAQSESYINSIEYTVDVFHYQRQHSRVGLKFTSNKSNKEKDDINRLTVKHLIENVCNEFKCCKDDVVITTRRKNTNERGEAKQYNFGSNNKEDSKEYGNNDNTKDENIDIRDGTVLDIKNNMLLRPLFKQYHVYCFILENLSAYAQNKDMEDEKIDSNTDLNDHDTNYDVNLSQFIYQEFKQNKRLGCGINTLKIELINMVQGQNGCEYDREFGNSFVMNIFGATTVQEMIYLIEQRIKTWFPNIAGATNRYQVFDIKYKDNVGSSSIHIGDSYLSVSKKIECDPYVRQLYVCNWESLTPDYMSQSAYFGHNDTKRYVLYINWDQQAWTKLEKMLSQSQHVNLDCYNSTPNINAAGAARQSTSKSKLKLKLTKEKIKNSDESEWTVNKCVELYTDIQEIEDSFCDNCNRNRKMNKIIDLWTLPEILIIHLRRFRKLKSGRLEKLNNFVNFPVNGLDLNDFIVNDQLKKDDNIYDLYGVTYHSGTCEGGHYWAKCLNSIDSKWREFNDTYVSKPFRARGGSIVNNNAFLLFYKKRHVC